MTDLVEMHGRCMQRFGELVHAVGPDDWDRQTPCTEWDVRALVEHVVGEQYWVPPLMAGKPMDEAERQVPSDALGDDPVAAWDSASAAARAAVAEPGALDRTVHLSRGQAAAAEYVTELTFDLLVHGWDLARAIGADEELDPEAVRLALDMFVPQAEALAASGMFAAPVSVPPNADEQTRLLALTGRRSW